MNKSKYAKVRPIKYTKKTFDALIKSIEAHLELVNKWRKESLAKDDTIKTMKKTISLLRKQLKDK